MSAIFAMYCIRVMAADRTTWTGLPFNLVCPRAFSEFNSYYTRGHRNDSISKQHNKRCQKFPQCSYRENITVSNRGDRYNAPVNALGDIAEPFIHRAFDYVYNGSHHYGDDQYKCKKNKYPSRAGLEG